MHRSVLNGGTIEDAGGNDAILTFTPPTTTGVLVDAVAPVADRGDTTSCWSLRHRPDTLL